MDKEILDSIKTVLDRFDLTYSEDIDNDINDSLLILKNKNIELIDRITNHIKKTKSKKKRLIDFIKSVSEFKERRGGIILQI